MDIKHSLPYSCEYRIPNSNSQSYFSLFNDNGLKQDSYQVRMKNFFSNFANSRINYLNSLRVLGNNWISGKSLQPTEKSIYFSIQLLENLKEWVKKSDDKNLNVPKIVMGPSPSGGIGMKIEISEDLKMYLSILDEKFDCEIEVDGYFEDYPINSNDFLSPFTYLYNLKLYNNHERRHYTQRRNII